MMMMMDVRWQIKNGCRLDLSRVLWVLGARTHRASWFCSFLWVLREMLWHHWRLGQAADPWEDWNDWTMDPSVPTKKPMGLRKNWSCGLEVRKIMENGDQLTSWEHFSGKNLERWIPRTHPKLAMNNPTIIEIFFSCICKYMYIYDMYTHHTVGYPPGIFHDFSMRQIVEPGFQKEPSSVVRGAIVGSLSCCNGMVCALPIGV